MLLLVIVVIALGWAAFGISLARDSLRSKRSQPSGARASRSILQSPTPSLSLRSGPFGIPQTNAAARVRRQNVLASLIVAAILTYLLTQLWTFVWVVHIAVDVALVAFVVALYLRWAKSQPTALGSSRGVRIQPARY